MTKRLLYSVFASLLAAGIFVAPAAATVLWDNGPLVNCEGCGAGGADESQAQNISLGLTGTGYMNSIADGALLADDFTVDGGVWDVTRITVFAYQNGSTAVTTFDDLRYQIWDGPPNDPASSVVYGGLTNSISGSDWTNIYRVAESITGNTDRPIMRIYSELEPGTLILSPGTYWLVWQTGGSLGAGPFAPPVTIDGEVTTGNALWFTIGVWKDVLDFGLNTPQGMPFVIEGSEVANFNFATGTLIIPLVTVDGSVKRYRVELGRIPGTWDFSLIEANTVP